MILTQKYRNELRRKSNRDIKELGYEWIILTVYDLLGTADELERRLLAATRPFGEEEWNGKYKIMGNRSRETVNDLVNARKEAVFSGLSE